MTKGGVSVVIPHFRSTAELHRALSSVAAQTQEPIEVIVVDDASGLDILSEVSRIANEFGQSVRVESLAENRGPAAARNYGWEMSKGEYVAFLDADDYWHPRKIEIQSKSMDRHPDVALSSHTMATTTRDTFEELNECEPSVSGISYRALLWGNRVATSSAMVRRGAPFRFPRGRRFSEDYALWLMLAHETGVVHIQAPLGTRVTTPGSLSSRLLSMQLGELRTLRDEAISGRLSWIAWPAVAAWSLAKFVVRILRGAK